MLDERSLLSFDALELIIAFVVAIVGVLGFYWSMQDPGYFMLVDSCFPLEECCGDVFDCDIPERTQMFAIFSIPLGCVLAAGSIFLVRIMRNKVRGSSRLGRWAMVWPMLTSGILFIGGPLLTILLVCTLPIPFTGLILAIIASVKSSKTQRNYGNFYAIFFNLFVIIFEGIFLIFWQGAAYIQ